MSDIILVLKTDNIFQYTLTKAVHPVSMKNLSVVVRSKIIKIANAA